MSHHYTMCGLDYIYLLNGYTSHETDYGAGISIERADQLDLAIAERVLGATGRLRGQEVRFLRSLAQVSQEDLARCLGVKRLTVARWEAAPTTAIPGPADRALRAVAAMKLFGDAILPSVVEVMSRIGEQQPQRIVMEYVQEEGSEPLLFPEEPADSEENEGWRITEAA